MAGMLPREPERTHGVAQGVRLVGAGPNPAPGQSIETGDARLEAWGTASTRSALGGPERSCDLGSRPAEQGVEGLVARLELGQTTMIRSAAWPYLEGAIRPATPTEGARPGRPRRERRRPPPPQRVRPAQPRRASGRDPVDGRGSRIHPQPRPWAGLAPADRWPSEPSLTNPWERQLPM